MKNKNGITVLVPVHEFTEVTKALFDNCVLSLVSQTEQPEAVGIIVPKGSEAYDYVKAYDFKNLNVTIMENDGDTNFAAQVNFGVENTTTEWFSILEMDDEFSKIWLKNVVKYREVYGDVELFLPLVVDVNETGDFIGLTNESVWASEFSDEMGYLDNNAVLGYQNFNFDGMVMRRDTYIENGGIKASMKLNFIYEFFLRMTYLAVRTMVIPKFGYKHVNSRKGSLFSDYLSLPADEARWWMSLAKKEYFHTRDRGLTYDKQTN